MQVRDSAFGVGSAYVMLKTSVHACENRAGFYASQRLASNNDIGRGACCTTTIFSIFSFLIHFFV